MTKLHNPLTDRLFEAILKLENIDAMYALRDSINLAIEKAEKENESVDESDDGWEDD